MKKIGLLFVVAFIIGSFQLIEFSGEPKKNNSSNNANIISVYLSSENNANSLNTKLNTNKFKDTFDFYNYFYKCYSNRAYIKTMDLNYVPNQNYTNSGIVCFNFNDEFG